jgi:hypothetical protein
MTTRPTLRACAWYARPLVTGPMVYGDWNCGANRNWMPSASAGRAVAHLDVMLEQPCATLEDCASVKTATGLPMKLDETGARHRHRC